MVRSFLGINRHDKNYRISLNVLEMIESLIELFSQVEPTQSQEIINSSWDKLNLLYKNKSIIQPLIQIYDDTTNPQHKFLSIHGMYACLSNSFIHFNQAELFLICAKIVDMYLEEEEPFFKIMISDIICFLINHIQQTWDDLDHLIYQSQPSLPNYMKMLFRYSIYFPNEELILLKVQQSFNYDLKIQLEGFEILLFFIGDNKKIYNTFSKKIYEMVNLVFTSNDVSCFNIFCLIYEKFFPKVYIYCNIFPFISNLNNSELNPSILISLRDFLNNHIIQMLEYQYQLDQKKIDDKEQYFSDVLNEIFTKEVSLSIYLFSIEIDEMTTTSENFLQLVNSVPQELVETTIHELASTNENPTIATIIPLISAYIQTYGCNEENYDFFSTLFTTKENIITKMAITSLYELKEYCKPFFQPSLLEFLMNWTIELKNDENDNQFFIHFSIVYISNFIQEFEDISPFLNEVFDFALKILSEGNETEAIDILILFDLCIKSSKEKNDELYSQLVEIILQLIGQSDCNEIVGLSYSVLTSILFNNKALIEPYVDTLLLNLNNIYSLKFISIILAFFDEKAAEVVNQNLQKIIDICNAETKDPLRILTACQTEVTIFAYFKAKADFSESIFNLLFLVIQNAASEMHEPIKDMSTTLFLCLRDNDDNFDPNSISPLFLKLLNEALETDILVIEIVLLIINIYKDTGKFDFSPFLDYVMDQIESIFQSEKADLFESVLICFSNFLDVIIPLLDDQIVKNVTRVPYTFLDDKRKIVKMTCLQILLDCEKKINIQDENIIDNIICMINEKENGNKDDDLVDEIACTATHFVRLMMQKDQELVEKRIQSIIELSLNKLKCSNDQELSENLIFILINLENYYKDIEELYQEITNSILIHFPVKIDSSIFELCYGWMIKKLDDLDEELKLIAFKSIVYFIACDVRQFYEDENVSGQLLEALYSIALSLPKQLIEEALNNDHDMMLVFLSHIDYIKSNLNKS